MLQKGADPNLLTQDDRTVFQHILMANFNQDPSLLKIYFKYSRPDVSFIDENALSLLEIIWSQPEIKLIDGKPLSYYLWGGGAGTNTVNEEESPAVLIEPDLNFIVEESLSLLQFLLYDVFLFTQYINKWKSEEYKGGSVIAYALTLHRGIKYLKDFISKRHIRVQQALLLINEGADLTYRDPFGKLPLHQAVRFYSPAVAERIIKKGGTLYLTKQDREFAIEMAIENNHDKVVNLLTQKPFPREPSLKEKFVNSCHSILRKL